MIKYLSKHHCLLVLRKNNRKIIGGFLIKDYKLYVTYQRGIANPKQRALIIAPNNKVKMASLKLISGLKPKTIKGKLRDICLVMTQSKSNPVK